MGNSRTVKRINLNMVKIVQETLQENQAIATRYSDGRGGTVAIAMRYSDGRGGTVAIG